MKQFVCPAPSQKATFQSEILELGSCNNLAQHDMCPILFPQISLHPSGVGSQSRAAVQRVTSATTHKNVCNTNDYG